ncbi:alpha/beta-hydrolase [Dendrothele bispora CBS 962.96]|uniref:Alpha/beta-hydrolase n=1 Tax=Dendrothele bispora (strain CBS 962.96) TaxID=1314807 RepID=A0A4V4HF29_DENBC|nr:alpha/beta-hydrolase [Dendrothele bispora CBS 962.96]
MDTSAYRTNKNSRGYIYRYHFTSPQGNHPVIVFIHGFPSTSYVWRYQIEFFKEKGYGLIVPDMLGYSGTSIVLETAAYKHSLLAKDLLDILDAEKIQQVIIIGHDWGSAIASRFVQLYSDRVIAAGFFAAGFSVPNPKFDYETVLKFTKEKFGSDLIGYWDFFASEGADKIIEEHWDAFCGLVWADDPRTWDTHLSPRGAIKEYLLSGTVLPPASWYKEEDRQQQTNALLMGGFSGPLNYYKLLLSGLSNDDDATIPVEKYETDKPTFFGVAIEDFKAIIPVVKANFAKSCKNATIKDFETSHWPQLQAPDEVNKELLAWIESL